MRDRGLKIVDLLGDGTLILVNTLEIDIERPFRRVRQVGEVVGEVGGEAIGSRLEEALNGAEIASKGARERARVN